jgi:DNA-binding beta-propeller fold protein YncE
MSDTPLEPRAIEISGCAMGEDIVFSKDGKRWFLTCMASDAVIVGDAGADRQIETIKTSVPYPHGISIHDGIDRILITNTIKGDLTDPGEMIAVIEASTGKLLTSHKVSMKPSPSGEAPVEVIFVPGTNPPVALITNMFGATLWAAVWNPGKKDFDVSQIYDFATIKAGVPLEMYFNEKATRLYLTTAVPGALHIFDIDGHPTRPRLLKTLPAAAGAHHVAITKDMRLAFVQNNLLGLENMNDGSITVIDLENEKVIGSIDTFKEQGLLPNLIVLLPKWNFAGGH